MAQSAPAGRSAVTARRVIVVILLVASIVGALGVPIYARTTPELGPFPFFYWYQLVLVPVVAIVCWLCSVLLKVRPAPPRAADDGEAHR